MGGVVVVPLLCNNQPSNNAANADDGSRRGSLDRDARRRALALRRHFKRPRLHRTERRRGGQEQPRVFRSVRGRSEDRQALHDEHRHGRPQRKVYGDSCGAARDYQAPCESFHYVHDHRKVGVVQIRKVSMASHYTDLLTKYLGGNRRPSYCRLALVSARS